MSMEGLREFFGGGKRAIHCLGAEKTRRAEAIMLSYCEYNNKVGVTCREDITEGRRRKKNTA